MATKKIAKNIKFEDALAALEQQVEQLERGEMPLDEAIAAFQYGTELSKVCLDRLTAAKQQVAKLQVPDPAGEAFTEAPFEEDGE